jgi:hypothetical protein
LLLRHRLQGFKGQAPALKGIATTGLLQIRQSLLTQAAVMPARPQLQQLM